MKKLFLKKSVAVRSYEVFITSHYPVIYPELLRLLLALHACRTGDLYTEQSQVPGDVLKKVNDYFTVEVSPVKSTGAHYLFDVRMSFMVNFDWKSDPKAFLSLFNRSYLPVVLPWRVSYDSAL
jgi:hypothetical protein